MTDATVATTPSSTAPAAPSPSPAAAAPAAASTQTPASPATTAAPTPSSTPTARPQYLPETAWDAATNAPKVDALLTEFEKTVKERNEYAAFKAAEDSRKLTLPQSPEAYELALPKDFKAPEGIDVKIDAANPAYTQLRQFAHANGMSQEQVSGLLGILGGYQAAEAVHMKALSAQHLEGLGAAKEARIDSVTRWLTASFGEKAKPIVATLATKDHVEVFESIIQKLSSQGSAGFTQQGREVNTGKVDDAAWAKMSYGEKKAYAEKHGNRAA